MVVPYVRLAEARCVLWFSEPPSCARCGEAIMYRRQSRPAVKKPYLHGIESLLRVRALRRYTVSVRSSEGGGNGGGERIW